ncbi:MAG: transcription termination/antitermination protein NusG [Gammaproteobacteria bacterium TMED112]|nr:MAG: transcription termination/antitermination protein NusG [Gammaproteobacteria bacterium TMED112]|tara:strand:+ start:1584 stop:2111 length:528 start_codon:yes stop_codon:yes gene_type:complete
MEYYVIQAFSNCEKKVKAALEERINMSGLSDMFGDIMIPTEQVTELKKGQKKQMERKFFPGYMLVQMEMNDDTWHLVRKTPNVMGFMGGTRNKPMPLSENELNKIINRVETTTEQPIFKTMFESGETVRINDGPFNDFNGIVEEVDYDKNLIKVSVSIFGKATPVELNFSQVEKN